MCWLERIYCICCGQQFFVDEDDIIRECTNNCSEILMMHTPDVPPCNLCDPCYDNLGCNRFGIIPTDYYLPRDLLNKEE